MEETPKQERDVGAFLDHVRKRWAIGVSADEEDRIRRNEDARMAWRDQWDPNLRRQRELKNKPCLQFNTLQQKIKQPVNDFRQAMPQVDYIPSDGGDSDVADLFDGLYRAMAARSNLPYQWGVCADWVVATGLGYIRIATDYASPTSFDQVEFVEAVDDPNCVVMDPGAQDPFGTDAQWAFVSTALTKEEFQRQYPKAEAVSANFGDMGRQYPDWFIGDDMIRVVEYFRVEHEGLTIAMLPDGSVVDLRDVPDGYPVVQTRETKIPRVKWCKTNGIEILEESEWIGDMIPIIRIPGEVHIVEGLKLHNGMVRYVRDAVQAKNYWMSRFTEQVALVSAPWQVAVGQIDGFEEAYAAAHYNNAALLHWRPRVAAEDGTYVDVPPPQRSYGDAPIAALAQGVAIVSDLEKASTGQFDASLGAKSNETSGIAIQRRQAEGDVATFHFIDNLKTAMIVLGKHLLPIWRRMYGDIAREVRVIGEDGQSSRMKIGQPTVIKGIEKVLDITRGQYDVQITTGPSYATRRQQMSEAMIELTRSMPVVAQAAPDLVVQSLDIPGAQAIAERVKKTLPPELTAPDEEVPIPPQVQAQMMQAQRAIELLQAENQDLSRKIETKRLEVESRERIANAQIQKDLVIELARQGQADAQLLMEKELEDAQRRLTLLNEDVPISGAEQPNVGPPMAQNEVMA